MQALATRKLNGKTRVYDASQIINDCGLQNMKPTAHYIMQHLNADDTNTGLAQMVDFVRLLAKAHAPGQASSYLIKMADG